MMQSSYTLKLLVLIGALAAGFPAGADPLPGEGDAAGTVKTVKGKVTVERNARFETLAVGSKVFQHDRIVTGDASTVGITFNDDGRVSLGASSSFTITKFAYNPNTREGGFVGSMLKGSLRFVTGLLGKASPRSVSINTPTATIGIRGTDFIVTVAEAEGAANAQ